MRVLNQQIIEVQEAVNIKHTDLLDKETYPRYDLISGDLITPIAEWIFNS